jgi:aminoglycoside phosphotransferase (APT) family kinase protein
VGHIRWARHFWPGTIPLVTISSEAAVAVATRLAEDLGLGSVTPHVLRDGSNVVVRLHPTPLVARVATLTAVVRPEVHRWLASDISVAFFLAARGVPVVSPSTDPPPGPYSLSGTAVSLWHHVPHDPSSSVSPAELASLLGPLHAALRSYPVRPAGDGPLGDHRRALTVLERLRLLDPGVLRLLRAEGERLGAEVYALPGQPLHGDAHPANILVTPDGPVWNDFEDSWVGPLAWDYACMANSRSHPGDWAGVASGLTDPAELAACRELRSVFGVAWYQLVAHRFPWRAAQARAALDAWLP